MRTLRKQHLEQGAYEWLIMNFLLTGTPGTFRHLGNDLFREFLDKFVIVYIDNLIIYSKVLEEHMSGRRCKYCEGINYRLNLKSVNLQYKISTSWGFGRKTWSPDGHNQG